MAKIELELDSAGLKLLNPGTTKLYKKLDTKANWKIKDSRIDSFRLESKVIGSYYPFTNPPNSNFVKKEELEIDDCQPTGIWDYKIIWKDSLKLKEHTLDPKIAVNTFPLAQFLIQLFAITGLLGLFFNFAKKLKNRH